MEILTPELVLVDPELAEVARYQGPVPQDSLTLQARPYGERCGSTIARLETCASEVSLPGEVAGAASPLLVTVVAIMLASAFIGPAAIDLVTRNGPAGASSRSPGPAAVVPSVPLVPSLQSLTSGRSGRVLGWQRVAGAEFYDVIRWPDGTRAIDRRPHEPSVRVPASALETGKSRRVMYPGTASLGGNNFGPAGKNEESSVRP